MRIKGKLIRSGAAFERKKKKIQRDFLNKLSEQIREAARKHGFQVVYLFVPKYLTNLVQEKLPSEVEQAVKRTIAGNFFREHPFTLLKKLQF